MNSSSRGKTTDNSSNSLGLQILINPCEDLTNFSPKTTVSQKPTNFPILSLYWDYVKMLLPLLNMFNKPSFA